MKPRNISTLDDEYWKILAKERINKQLKMSEIHSKEDYYYALNNWLRKPDSKGRPSGLNIIIAGKRGENYHKISYRQIKEAMYEGSKNDIIERKKRTFMSLYSVYEAKNTHVSSKGKVYTQIQYQDLKGRFVKNPFK